MGKLMHADFERLAANWQPKAIALADGTPYQVTSYDVRRFLAKIEMAADGCWRWTAGRDSQGYPFFAVGQRQGRAHRFAHKVFIGPIPAGLQVDHQCHTAAIGRGACAGGAGCLHRRCVNPAHLRAATARENSLAGLTVVALNAHKTICLNGHPLTEDLVYIQRDGSRACRQCKRDWDNRDTARRAAAEGREVKVPPGKRTHCPKNHPYDDVNTSHAKRGQRICRACQREQSRDYKARKKAERDSN